jgi:hypothetical protein
MPPACRHLLTGTSWGMILIHGRGVVFDYTEALLFFDALKE